MLALFIIIDRFSFVKYLVPISKVINLALIKVSLTLIYLTKRILNLAYLYLIKFMDYLTKSPEDENEEINEIYSDPFWLLYQDYLPKNSSSRFSDIKK